MKTEQTANLKKTSARNQRSEQIRSLTVMALFIALAFVVLLIPHIKIFGFLSLEFKDVVLVFASFIFGPIAGLSMSLVLSLIEMFTLSDTGIIGMFMNFLSSASFVCIASFFHKKNPSLKGAVIGLVLGCISMTAVMLLWNYLITPLYMNTTREAVVQMLIPIFLPFNILKSVLNASIAVMLYPTIGILEKSNLIPKRTNITESKKALNIGIIAFSAIALITCVYFVLTLTKVL